MRHSYLRITVACCLAALAAGCGGGGGSGNTAPQPPTAGPQATNAAPQLSAITGQSVDEDGAAEISFSVSDSETAANALKVSVAAANTTLLPANSFELGGTGTNRTLEVFPAAGQSGSSLVTVTVTDAAGAQTSGSFNVEVKPLLRAQFTSWFRGTVLSQGDEAPVGLPAEAGAALPPLEDISRIRFVDDPADEPAAYADLLPPPEEDDEDL